MSEKQKVILCEYHCNHCNTHCSRICLHCHSLTTNFSCEKCGFTTMDIARVISTNEVIVKLIKKRIIEKSSEVSD